MVRIAIALLLLIALADDTSARKSECRSNPEIIDECFDTHGRLTVGNGNPSFRIWPIGTMRILGVLHSEDPIMPEKIKKLMYGRNTVIYADFTVCPYTEEKKGWMRFVCIEDARNIVAERYDEKTKSTTAFNVH